MKETDLTREQIEAIQAALTPAKQYLNKLCDRMEKTGIGPTGKTYQWAVKAKDDLQPLLMELHYLGCDHGVGRPPRDKI